MAKPVIDMTPDGRFREPPRAPLSLVILRGAVVVAVLAGTLAAAVLALWFVLALIPVAIGAALVAWGAMRWRAWRAQGRPGGSLGGGGDLFRR